MLDRLAAIPEPQRNAFSVALGLSSGDAPDGFLVALAVLSLLSALAASRPLLCLVDDAHWLDAASGQALGFVARRLLAEPIAMLVVLREPVVVRTFSGLPELALGGLDEPDARALLARAVPGHLDDRVRDRIIAETRGNPLALLELSQSISAAERAGGYVDPTALPERLEAQYLRRVRALPEATRQLILLAAADPAGDAALLWRAAERLQVDPTAAAPAAEAGLLEIDDQVRFRHPLVRSAVYRAASAEDRRRVHRALAEASDPELDGDRRAWHLAAAAGAPDEDVAIGLERSAARAHARGGLAAAAALLQRAVALTENPQRRAERALTAADAGFQIGAFETSLGLVAEAEAEPLDGFQSARAEMLRAQVTYTSRHGPDGAPLLLRAARRLEPFDLDRARQAYLVAWGAAIARGEADVLDELCQAIRSLPARAGSPRPLDLLLEGVALLTTEGRAVATPVLLRAATAVVEMPDNDVLELGVHALAASSAVWDSESTGAIAERQVQIFRDAGALADLPIHLSALAMEKVWAGDLTSASMLVAESASVAAATGSSLQTFAVLRLRALQGREADAGPLIEATLQQTAARDQGKGEAARMAQWSAAVLYNGLARHDEAKAAANAAITDAIGPWSSIWALPELVEAATRTGEPELARDALDLLAGSTQPAGTDFALGMEARSRALVTRGAAAEQLYREAVERLSRASLRPEVGRAHLLLGEWLRERGRRGEAGEHLRIAEELFASIGMEAFGERARRELTAAGEKLRPRAQTAAELTPQEEQIARLARDGLTNAEIGAQLFLSPRTVEWHLHKVFTKLGISSRNGLRSTLSTTERML